MQVVSDFVGYMCKCCRAAVCSVSHRHLWLYGEWQPCDFAENFRFVKCPQCGESWGETR
jgi:hypothetical protein